MNRQSSTKDRGINLGFLGGFNYPHGMAGTKRVQHVIDGLRTSSEFSIRVLIVRQSSRQNVLEGVYCGTPYETIKGDLSRAGTLLTLPLIYAKGRRALSRLFLPDRHNLLFVYGPPSFDTLQIIRFARRLGFRVVFDIVEDDDLSREISKRMWHRLKVVYVRRAIKHISEIADGIIVIDSYLEKKFRVLTSGKVPIHLLPVSVDMDLYSQQLGRFRNPVTLFYAGSFGKKDGVPVLIDAFDELARERNDIQLVLTGIGSEEDMRAAHRRVENSPHKGRIKYEGYLDDASYYAALNGADILCMPRIDIGFAHAGFPFKLGEYLATGKPVIASATSSISDLLEDRRELMLVTPGDSAAVVEAARTLLEDEETAFAVGARGQAAARRLFDYRSQRQGLHCFLRHVSEQV